MSSMNTMRIPRMSTALVPWVAPGLRVMWEWSSTLDRDRWPAPPPGDGRPVMLIPGFLAGDPSVTRMALWLRGGGYTLARSGITWNTGCSDETVIALEDRLEVAFKKTGRRALVIGQSRGGSIGRVLAALRPDLIETLVTLGSPLLDPLDVHPHVIPSIAVVGALGSVGLPNMFSAGCLRGDCCTRSRDALTEPFPPDVEFLSLYSRTDEVVRWRSCLDPAARHIEVHTSHIGMGMAREVWTVLAHRLAPSRRGAAPPPDA